MKITVSKIPVLKGIVEGKKVEFKTSIFYSPNGKIEEAQYRVIAKEIAAFLNTEGGDLYLGVKDNGTVAGLANEFKTLKNGGSEIWIETVDGKGDSGYSYSGDADGYERKIRKLVQVYLSEGCEDFITYHKEELEGVEYARLEVEASPLDKIAYVKGSYEEEIHVRRGNRCVKLKGRERDNYVRDLYKQEIEPMQTELANVKMVVQELQQQLSEAPKGSSVTADELLEKLCPVLGGVKPVVEDGQPITKEGLAPIRSPGGLIVDGKHAGDAKSWKEIYLMLLSCLQKEMPAVFGDLPEDKYFGKYFVRETRKAGAKRISKCTGCYPDRFGAEGDLMVRAKEIPGKAHIADDDKVFKRLLARCGVDAGRFHVRPR